MSDDSRPNGILESPINAEGEEIAVHHLFRGMLTRNCWSTVELEDGLAYAGKDDGFQLDVGIHSHISRIELPVQKLPYALAQRMETILYGDKKEYRSGQFERMRPFPQQLTSRSNSKYVC